MLLKYANMVWESIHITKLKIFVQYVEEIDLLTVYHSHILKHSWYLPEKVS